MDLSPFISCRAQHRTRTSSLKSVHNLVARLHSCNAEQLTSILECCKALMNDVESVLAATSQLVLPLSAFGPQCEPGYHPLPRIEHPHTSRHHTFEVHPFHTLQKSEPDGRLALVLLEAAQQMEESNSEPAREHSPQFQSFESWGDTPVLARGPSDAQRNQTKGWRVPFQKTSPKSGLRQGLSNKRTFYHLD